MITGAGSGIGAGLVTYAAGLGMRIALADVDVDAIEKRSVELVAAGHDVIARHVDVRDAKALEALADEVYARWGEVTLLVNNAGVELHGNIWELPVEMWQRIVDVNLSGVFYGVRAFVPRMIAQGSRAHVVNVASVAALIIQPGYRRARRHEARQPRADGVSGRGARRRHRRGDRHRGSSRRRSVEHLRAGHGC